MHIECFGFEGRETISRGTTSTARSTRARRRSSCSTPSTTYCPPFQSRCAGVPAPTSRRSVSTSAPVTRWSGSTGRAWTSTSTRRPGAHRGADDHLVGRRARGAAGRADRPGRGRHGRQRRADPGRRRPHRPGSPRAVRDRRHGRSQRRPRPGPGGNSSRESPQPR